MRNVKTRRVDWTVALAAVFFALLAGLYINGMIPAMLLAGYTAVSLVAVAMYAIDKAAARGERRRIAESTLHLLALLGGWPGALVAQQWFRHKTRKQPFRFIFWCVAAVNCGALYWLVQAEQAGGVRNPLGFG
ncbi:MAG TPA: DUF1294 domain-containing protein [Halomonas sp.]|nr:DUF1294 domain-containing protein [Halomonas sp.]